MSRASDLAGLAEELARTQAKARRIVAIAGAPGSGKSTFAETLRAALAERVPCAVFPMDGFHFDDIVLNERGHRPRKGAPHTFDTGGLASMLGRLAADGPCDVAVPVFDRALEIARAGARIIPPSVRLVIAEGNYLLLDDPAWEPLRRFFDLSVFLEVPEAVLEERLRARWVGHGLAPGEVMAKLEENDLPNARLVARGSVPADIVIRNG